MTTSKSVRSGFLRSTFFIYVCGAMLAASLPPLHLIRPSFFLMLIMNRAYSWTHSSGRALLAKRHKSITRGVHNSHLQG